MGLWQNLVAGYDENPELWKMYPLSSTTIAWKSNSFAVIILKSDGSFIKSWQLPKSPALEIMAPGTQGSLGRTSTAIRPHALFDSRSYVFPSKSIAGTMKASRKFNEYRKQLKDFADSSFATEKIKAVCRYISSNRDFDADLPPGTDDTTYILFAVEINDDPIVNLWEDPTVYKAWSDYYSSKVSENNASQTLDFITGVRQQPAEFHPKKILQTKDAANAKLISANDTKNFTFRGLFSIKDQAVTVGYESSQKAHQYLRYLIASQGVYCGNQVIVPFSIGATGKRLPTLQVQDVDDDWDEDETETTADAVLLLGAHTGKGGYAASIRKALQGYELDRQWKAHARSAIVILEAATGGTGRLSITFYREFASSEYMERIAQWHEECKWPLWRRKGDKSVLYFGAPSIDKIIQAAFGWPKPGQDKAYEKIRMRARQNLIRTILDNVPIPRDYLENAIHRVSNPLGITDKDGKFNRNRFNSALATTCAILKHSNTKESFDMSIDLKRTDRDYLYGRLLGAADKLEQYALRKKDNDRLVTAAIRHMQTFSQRPFSAWEIIHQSLIPYKQQVRGCIADKEIQSIHDMFKGCEKEFENDSPLSGLYLVGYYHECAYIDERVREAYEKSSDNNQPKEN